MARAIVNSKAGRVLQAIRDAETRVKLSDYNPVAYKLAIWTLSAVMCGVAGVLYVPQVGISNPGEMSAAAGIEIAVWAVVGRQRRWGWRRCRRWQRQGRVMTPELMEAGARGGGCVGRRQRAAGRSVLAYFAAGESVRGVLLVNGSGATVSGGATLICRVMTSSCLDGHPAGRASPAALEDGLRKAAARVRKTPSCALQCSRVWRQRAPCSGLQTRCGP